MLGVRIESIGYDEGHVHMVIPPRYSIASVMGQLKSQSASRMRRKFQWLEKVYWGERIVWSTGYFVSSVRVEEKTIKSYVELQGNQDSGQLRMEL